MNDVPITHCIGTAHKFRRLAEEASDTSLAVLAKHLDMPMDDAESADFVRSALREAYAEIAEATHKDRAARAATYPQQADR